MVQARVRLEILSGWKEIADYLRKGVRTVQRYERELGLPIRRPAARSKGAVIATKAELDAWVSASPVGHSFQLTRTIFNIQPSLTELARHLQEMQRLRQETIELRIDVAASLETLRKNLRWSAPPILVESEPFPERRAPLNVVPFDASKAKIH